MKVTFLIRDSLPGSDTSYTSILDIGFLIIGAIVALIILSFAYTYYHIGYQYQVGYESSYKELRGAAPSKASYPMQENVYQAQSILLIYMNISSNKEVELTIIPSSIILYYKNGRKIPYPGQVFLADEFNLKKGENILVAAVVVGEGDISNIRIDGYYSLNGGELDNFSWDWAININVSMGKTIAVYLSINL